MIGITDKREGNAAFCHHRQRIMIRQSANRSNHMRHARNLSRSAIFGEMQHIAGQTRIAHLGMEARANFAQPDHQIGAVIARHGRRDGGQRFKD